MSKVSEGATSGTSPFSGITIIFNPHSTGSSRRNADQLVRDLAAAGVDVEVSVVATERRNHAAEIAYDVAMGSARPLIISASGDGGYNEVVNGALRAQTDGAKPVCAVLPAGNANDHSRMVAERPLAVAIADGEIRHIDVLETTIVSSAQRRIRYAHSYVGIGMTPVVAMELNRHNLTRLNEGFVVCRALWGLRPVEVSIEGKRRLLDSLVVANISQMAKVLTIARDVRPDDGRLTVTVFPHRHRLALLGVLLRAVVLGIRGMKARSYSFTALHDMTIQLDGEVEDLAADDTVTVTIDPARLSTLR